MPFTGANVLLGIYLHLVIQASDLVVQASDPVGVNWRIENIASRAIAAVEDTGRESLRLPATRTKQLPRIDIPQFVLLNDVVILVDLRFYATKW